jgi:hypothetical protein
MPVSLHQIATNTADFTLAWGEDIVHITYYPGRFTEKMVGDVQAISKLNEDTLVKGFQAFNETLANLIKSWDVYEDEAQAIMFPIDATRFPELPLIFRMEVFYAIAGDIRPEMVAPRS